MDDATAADNCGEVTIEVSSETTAGDAAGNYVIVRTFTATDDAGNSSSATQTITVQDTTAPEFTFVPDRLHGRVLRRDADGRRHRLRQLRRGNHRSVKRDDRRRCRRQLHDRSHVHCNRRRWKQQLLPRRPSPSRTPQLLSSPSCPPTTPSSAPTRCRWTTPLPQTTAARSRSKCQRDDCRRCCWQLRDRSHVHSHRRCWKQQLCHPDNHRPGHHRS